MSVADVLSNVAVKLKFCPINGCEGTSRLTDGTGAECPVDGFMIKNIKVSKIKR